MGLPEADHKKKMLLRTLRVVLRKEKDIQPHEQNHQKRLTYHHLPILNEHARISRRVESYLYH